MTKQHRIPDPPPITDRMVDGAIGAAPFDLVGQKIVTVYEMPDSDRDEVLLLLGNGRCLEMSCDLGYNDDVAMSRNPNMWVTVLYDATDTEAGRMMKQLRPGHWR